ncbi:MAG: sensor histidine kinase [bacterium]
MKKSDPEVPSRNESLGELDTELVNQNTGELIGAVVHEIRTPLNKLSLMIQNSDSDDVDRMVSTVDEINQTVNLVESVFRGSQPNKEWIHAGTFFGEVHKRLAQSGDLEFCLELDWIHLNMDRMVVAVENLITNSLEAYSDDEDTVRVTAKPMGPEVCVTVRDWAGGFNVNYNRSDSDSQTKEELDDSGMGLGLMIVKRIANNHNGRMAIRSQKPKGTEVTITLPQPG